MVSRLKIDTYTVRTRKTKYGKEQTATGKFGLEIKKRKKRPLGRMENMTNVQNHEYVTVINQINIGNDNIGGLIFIFFIFPRLCIVIVYVERNRR